MNLKKNFRINYTKSTWVTGDRRIKHAKESSAVNNGSERLYFPYYLSGPSEFTFRASFS